MKNSKTLRNYTILCILGFSLIFFQKNILSTINEYLDSSDGAIAQIENSEGIVKVKNQASLWFKEVFTGKKLKDQDTMITNETSTAHIKFITDDEILIEPNSIVVISLPTDEMGKKNIKITFTRGSFKVLKKGSKSEPKIIMVKNDVERNLSALSISADAIPQEKTHAPASVIEVIDAKPDAAAEPQPAPAPVQVEAVSEKPREPTAENAFVAPSVPKFEQTKYNFELWNNEPQDLSPGFKAVKKPLIAWEYPGTERIYFQLQLSRNKDFSQIDLEKVSSKPFTEFSVNSGFYYSRVRAYDDSQNSSKWSDIAEIRVVTAQPTSLSHESQRSNMARLYWQGDKPQESYEIEIRGPDLKKHTYFSNKEDQLVTLDQEGKYTWKTRVINDQSWPISKWSKPHSFDHKTDIPLASVSDEEVKPLEEEVVAVKAVEKIKLKEEEFGPSKKQKFFAKASVGGMLYDAKQANTALSESGQFKSFSPSYQMDLAYYWNKRNYVDLNFNLSSITIKPAGGLTIDNDKFDIMSYGVTVNHMFAPQKNKYYYSLYYGAYQEHSPFITLGTTTDVIALESKIIYGVLGIKRTQKYSDKAAYSFGLAYQHPLVEDLATATQYDIKPKYSVLGSIDIDYKLSKNSILGVAYSVNATDYDYNYSVPSTGASPGHLETMAHEFYLSWKYLPFANIIYLVRRRKKKTISNQKSY